MTPTRILIVDDHALFAEAIRLTLDAHGVDVVGIVHTVEEGLEAVHRLRPDVALVDIGLPDGSGLALGERILEDLPETKVVALSALGDPRAVRDALKIGFHGYIIKDTSISKFVNAIEAVLSGEVVVPRALAPRVAGKQTSDEQAVALLVDQLTPRERQVLELLVEGASGQTIARTLGISPNTVRTHVQNVLTKLQVRSRLEAATFAVRHRIVPLPPQDRYPVSAF
jgi:two-component system, NarL family, nitrate/nitrite response regulator NarL